MKRHSPSTSNRAEPLVPESTVRFIESELKKRTLDRDRIGELARDLRRGSQDVMRRLHFGESVGPRMKALGKLAYMVVAKATSSRIVDEEFVNSSLQEWAEANLLWAVIERRRLPSPNDLGISAAPYLLGLSDLVGEIRRLAVTALGKGEVQEAKRCLALMDALYSTLMRFDAPRSIIAMKPKQDIARSLVEKTRGEVESALFLHSMLSRSSSKRPA